MKFRFRSAAIAFCLAAMSTGAVRADNIIVVGTNSTADIITSLEAAGHTVSHHVDDSTVDSAVLAGVDTVILLRTPGNSSVVDFVNNGGYVITEYSASEWALNTANLLDADQVGNSFLQDQIDFTALGISSGLADGLGASYSELGATDFYTPFANIGASVEIYGEGHLSNQAAIIGGSYGNGNVLAIGYDWADGYTLSSNTDRLLHNALGLFHNVWDGSDSHFWNNPNNWSKDIVPGAGDHVYIGGNTNTTIDHNVSAGTMYKSLKFRSGAAAFDIVGSAIGIADGGVIRNSSTNEQNISVVVISGGNITVDAAAGGLEFNNSVWLGSGHTLTVTGSHNVQFDGAITNGSLAKRGTGTLLLNHANTFAGIDLGGGRTVVGSDDALGPGLISVTADSTLESNSSRTINNNFTIDASRTITIDGAHDVTLSGEIYGYGALTKTGTGELTLTGPNTYLGGTTVSQGTLRGDATSVRGDIVNNAELIFEQPTDAAYDGILSGSGQLQKNSAGTLVMNGANSFAGSTSVNAGTLLINSQLGGNVTAQSGATFGGSGNLTSNVLNHGTIAPGNNAIGTLSVGEYTQSSTGVLQIEIDDAGTTPGVHADQLVSGGDANLSGSVSVINTGTGSSYRIGQQYTFLTASTLNGAFDSITDNLAAFDAELGYTGHSVYFRLIRAIELTEIARNYNQLQVARTLQSIDGTTTGPMADMLNALAMLTPTEAAQVLSSMEADVTGTIAQLGVQNSIHLYTLLSRRAFGPGNNSTGNSFASTDSSSVVRGQDSGPQWTGWISGYGLGGIVQSDGNASGGDYQVGGTAFGIERALDDCTAMGLFGGYANYQLGSDSGLQSAEVNSGQLGSYLRRTDGVNYYLLAGSMGVDDYLTTRRIIAGPIDETADGDYHGWQSSARLERGLDLQLDSFNLRPFAALQYVYLEQSDYTEGGAGAFNLAVDETNTHALRSSLGLYASQEYCTAGGMLFRPQLHAIWLHEFLDGETTLTSQFVGAGGPAFSTRGLDLGRDWALLGFGGEWNLTDSLSVFANYDAQVNEQQIFHIGSGGLQKIW